MGGINSRRKGSAAERELATAMHDELGVRMQRRLEQYRSGGSDLAVHPDEHSPVADQLRKLSIECKRAAKTTPALCC